MSILKSQRPWIPCGVALLSLLSACVPNPASPDAATNPITTAAVETAQEEAETTMADELDLKFANVVGVSFERISGNSYRFDVTLLHDDDGEAPQYADWWQVDDLQGNELGRRLLLHAHITAPFTRSLELGVPGEVPKSWSGGMICGTGTVARSCRSTLQRGKPPPSQNHELARP